MTKKNYKGYICEVCEVIKERALQAKEEEKSDKNLFNSGRLMAFNEVVSILQQDALGMGIDLNELKLDDIKPDTDLVENV